jgi:hypothetical protein
VDLAGVPHEVGDGPPRAAADGGVEPGALGGVGEGEPVAPQRPQLGVTIEGHQTKE